MFGIKCTLRDSQAANFHPLRRRYNQFGSFTGAFEQRRSCIPPQQSLIINKRQNRILNVSHQLLCGTATSWLDQPGRVEPVVPCQHCSLQESMTDTTAACRCLTSFLLVSRRPDGFQATMTIHSGSLNLLHVLRCGVAAYG